MPRIPRYRRTYTFPGFTVEVKHISAREMKKLCGEVAYGAWIAPVIYINKDEPTWEQLRTFYHEMKHALVDAEHHVRMSIVEPLQIEAGQTLSDLSDDE